MKKIIISLILAAALVLSFAACDKTEPNPVDETVITLQGINLDGTPEKIDRMLLNPDRFMPILTDGAGMTKETAQSFFDAPEEWLVYSYTVLVGNSGTEELTVYGIDVVDNGANDVYLNCDLGAELGVTPGGEGYLAIDVFCSNVDLTDDDVKAIVDAMTINVNYSASLADDTPEGVTAETKIASVNTAA